MKKPLLLLLLCCLSPMPGWAQTAINPTTVEFQASPDHAAVVPGTAVPILDRYLLAVYAPGATLPTQSYELGKPTPDANGKISVNIADVIVGLPVSATIVYTAKVVAIGPGGENTSEGSNPFVRVAPPRPASGVTLVRR